MNSQLSTFEILKNYDFAHCKRFIKQREKKSINLMHNV